MLALSCFSHVWLFATLWTVARQAPVFMVFSSKNTGVGCHALHRVYCICSCCENHSVVSGSLWPQGLYSPWNSPDQNTEVGSLSLLQGIFPTQGSNPGLPHCRRILYQLNHKGSPRIPEWVAYPFSSGSSRTRNQTRVSCIAGRFFTNWAIMDWKKKKKNLLWLTDLIVDIGFTN